MERDNKHSRASDPDSPLNTDPARAERHDMTPERAPHAHARPRRDMSHIQGWGADLDKKNRPAYPMERTPARLDNVHWDVPAQQPINMEILHSTERPGVSPVFGTSAPLKGLSGWLRRAAYKFSESDLRRWLTLLLADRVDVVEGLGQDLMQGQVPNPLAEMGIKAEMRHNPAGLAKKALIAGAVLGIGYYLLTREKGNRGYEDEDSFEGDNVDPHLLSYDAHSYASEHPYDAQAYTGEHPRRNWRERYHSAR